MELREFTLLIKSTEFGYNIGGFLGKILENYTHIMRLIVKIEQLEKYIKRGDIFDAKFYIQQLNRDILEIINHIEKQLSQRLSELKNISIINDEKEYEKITIKASLDEQNIRITLLVTQITSMLSKIQNLKNQLNCNSITE